MPVKSRKDVKNKVAEEIKKRLLSKTEVETTPVEVPEDTTVLSLLDQKGISRPDTFAKEEDTAHLLDEAFEFGYDAAFSEEEPVNPFLGTPLEELWQEGYYDGTKSKYLLLVTECAVSLVKAQNHEEVALFYGELKNLVENNYDIVEDIFGVPDERD